MSDRLVRNTHCQLESLAAAHSLNDNADVLLVI